MSDARWMTSALALARRRLGQTWPNPAVGCVIVKDGRVLGRAATAPGGRPHAETIALAQAKNSTGATAYVTLEPCAHHGHTPPCADALIAAGITRVVCPITDPDPRVAGRGFARLREAEISVDIGLMEHEARAVNAGFLSKIERRRPWVSLKLAMTLDGRIATGTGESRWITGPLARRRVHLMRAQADAVMIGAGTARMDDPMLDVRELGLSWRKPVRIVADPGISLPLTGRLATTANTHPLWILHRADADPDRVRAIGTLGGEPLAVPAPEGLLDIGESLGLLAGRGITRLMVEGGGRLAASLLKASMVDEISLFSAGKVFGNDGIPGVQAFGLEALGEAPAFDLAEIEQIGSDSLTRWRVRDDDKVSGQPAPPQRRQIQL